MGRRLAAPPLPAKFRELLLATATKLLHPGLMRGGQFRGAAIRSGRHGLIPRLPRHLLCLGTPSLGKLCQSLLLLALGGGAYDPADNRPDNDDDRDD